MASRKPVPLSNQKVWDDISAEVKKSYKNACIVFIEECVAPIPKSRYETYKALLGESQELTVWHGTKEHLLDKIATEGFDPQYNKRSAYGKGVYFSSTLSISLDEEYASKGSEGLNVAFLCKIVAKSFGTERSSITANGKVVVDSVSDPKIFVVNDIRQSVPIYIVGFYKSV